jgi:hypothetical protein
MDRNRVLRGLGAKAPSEVGWRPRGVKAHAVADPPDGRPRRRRRPWTEVSALLPLRRPPTTHVTGQPTPGAARAPHRPERQGYVPSPIAGIGAFFSFDEGSGQVVHDLSGNGNTGQLGSSAAVEADDPLWIPSGVPFR